MQQRFTILLLLFLFFKDKKNLCWFFDDSVHISRHTVNERFDLFFEGQNFLYVIKSNLKTKKKIFIYSKIGRFRSTRRRRRNLRFTIFIFISNNKQKDKYVDQTNKQTTEKRFICNRKFHFVFPTQSL